MNIIFTLTKNSIMKTLNFLLSYCALANAINCNYVGSGFIFDNWHLSQIYICSQGENYQENITIKVKTGNKEDVVIPNVDYGYQPGIFIGNFSDNNLDQILYFVNSGGSGAYSSYQLFKTEGEEIVSFFDSNDFNPNIQVGFENNTIKISYQNQTVLLDASKNDLAGKKEVVVSSVNTILPVYNTAFSRYQILTYQKVYIDYTANNVGYLTFLLDFADGTANVVNMGSALNFDYGQKIF